METTIKKLPKSEIELKIEVSAQEFNNFIDKATLNLGKDLEIKGFRKGKVPKGIAEKEIGSEKILIEAADLAVRENYGKAILENKIEAVSQPKIEIQKLAKGNSFIFLAKTAVLPEIKLADYTKIASGVKRKQIKVEEKEIEAALKWLQRSRAKLTSKNQPSQKGDFVEIEYNLSRNKDKELGSLSLKEPSSLKDQFILGEGHFLSGFEEEIIGMKPDQEKDNITLNKDGRELKVKLKVKAVQNVEFPEIDDKFAKSLGKFDNLTALKNGLKQGLGLEKEQAESQRIRNEILEKISQATKCEIPEVLVQGEQRQMLENLKKNVEENLKMSFTDYLNKLHPVKSSSPSEIVPKAISPGQAGISPEAKLFNRVKKTEKEIMDSFLAQAQKKVKFFLVLGEIGKREKVEVSESEVKEKVNEILRQCAGVGVDPERLKDYTKEVIRTEKTLTKLENLTSKP